MAGIFRDPRARHLLGKAGNSSGGAIVARFPVGNPQWPPFPVPLLGPRLVLRPVLKSEWASTRLHLELHEKVTQFEQRPDSAIGHSGAGAITFSIDLPSDDRRRRFTALAFIPALASQSALAVLTPAPWVASLLISCHPSHGHIPGSSRFAMNDAPSSATMSSR